MCPSVGRRRARRSRGHPPPAAGRSARPRPRSGSPPRPRSRLGAPHQRRERRRALRYHRALRALLEMLARERPVPLLLDDLHWADDASIELVLHLLRRPRGDRICSPSPCARSTPRRGCWTPHARRRPGATCGWSRWTTRPRSSWSTTSPIPPFVSGWCARRRATRCSSRSSPAPLASPKASFPRRCWPPCSWRSRCCPRQTDAARRGLRGGRPLRSGARRRGRWTAAERRAGPPRPPRGCRPPPGHRRRPCLPLSPSAGAARRCTTQPHPRGGSRPRACRRRPGAAGRLRRSARLPR